MVSVASVQIEKPKNATLAAPHSAVPQHQSFLILPTGAVKMTPNSCSLR